MLYLLDLMANGIIEQGLVPSIKELNVRPATVSSKMLGHTNANAYTAKK